VPVIPVNKKEKLMTTPKKTRRKHPPKQKPKLEGDYK
jgi:hypothetical protein